MYFTITGVKKIVRCMESFVRGSLYYYYYYYYYYYSYPRGTDNYYYYYYYYYSYPRGTDKWPFNGGWQLNRGSSSNSKIFSRNITLY